MYKIETTQIANIFSQISDMTHNTLSEISIKKSRINFEFLEPSIVHISNIMNLLQDDLIDEDKLYFTALEGHIHLTYDCGDIVANDNVPNSSLFKPLFDLLKEIGEHICQCPALEYIIAQDYVKVFIDKPNMESRDLFDLEKVFDQSFVLELQKQRPYCLFIIMPDMAQTTLDVNTTELNPMNVITKDFEVPKQVLTSDMVRKI